MIEPRNIEMCENVFYLEDKRFNDEEQDDFYYSQDHNPKVDIARIGNTDFNFRIYATFVYCYPVIDTLQRILKFEELECDFALVLRSEHHNKVFTLKGRLERLEIISGNVINAEFFCKDFKK